MTHVMGLSVLVATLCAGVPLVRPDRFDATGFLRQIEARRPNVVVAVPTMYADLEAAHADAYDLSSVQLWVSSADVLPLDRARRFQRRGAGLRIAGRGVGSAAFLDIYGMVELSGPAAVRLLPPTPVGPAPAVPVALALPGIAVRAVDESGRAVRAGRVGELQWRGSGVLRGYAGLGDARGDDGWFASGDHGRVWPGGLLQFSGRSRDRCKVGGFSVFPAEIEASLRGAPGVAELAVVGVPDDRLGERLVLAVVPGGEYDEARLRTFVAERTSGYRRPRELLAVDGLPRGNHGKIDRERTTALVTQQMTGPT
jgi:acyl-CoA synthetase (AMP-forming)/AMP-acid ligase II